VEKNLLPCGSWTGAAARRRLVDTREGAQGTAVKSLDIGTLSLVGNTLAGEGTPGGATTSPLAAISGLSGSRSWKC
jgi:hypothetical protein